MKRLLLGPALALPMILGLCSLHKPELPKVPEVVGSVSSAAREIPLDDFNAFPLPQTTAPAIQPKVKPHAHPAQGRTAPARPARKPAGVPLPADRPRSAEAPVEALPPQQGTICIFPFSMIPNCTPQVAGQ